MAYINFKLLVKKDLSITQFMILQCCKQMKFEDVSNQLIELCGEESEDALLILEDKGLVGTVKGKAKDNLFQRSRLTPAGTKLMNALELPDVTDEDVMIWDWLVKMYRKKEKQIGNEKLGLLWLAQFRVNSGINLNKLSFLCKTFINDESRMEFSFQLDYVFFKPAHHNSPPVFDLAASKLWQYYNTRRDYFDKEFERIENESKSND